jgi:hypothetical protein
MCYNTTWWNMKCSFTLFLVMNNFWHKEHFFFFLPYVHFLVTNQISLRCIVLVLFFLVLVCSDCFTWTIKSTIQTESSAYCWKFWHGVWIARIVIIVIIDRIVRLSRIFMFSFFLSYLNQIQLQFLLSTVGQPLFRAKKN